MKRSNFWNAVAAVSAVGIILSWAFAPAHAREPMAWSCFTVGVVCAVLGSRR